MDTAPAYCYAGVASSDPFPLSYGQESLWLADRMADRDGPAYNEPLAFRISGEISVEVLREALRGLLLRHESLRLGCRETPEGLRAVVRDDVPDVLDVRDLRELPQREADERAAELVESHYRMAFDLSTGPLLRAELVLLPGTQSILALTLHHLATDGRSNEIILRELGQDYQSLRNTGRPARLSKPAARFADHVGEMRLSHERGEYDHKIAHWKRAIEAGPELLHMPLDHPRPPVQTFRGTSTAITVPRENVDALLTLCRRECRSTDFTVLLAAYALLLNRYTGQDSVTIGTTVLNRHREEFLDVVGCFANTAALVLDLDEDMTFRDLLRKTTEASRDLLDYGDAPYPKVLESLTIPRDPSHNPVFQTMLTVLGHKPVLDLGEGTVATPHRVPRAASKFEVLLYVSEYGGEVEFEAEFNSDLLALETVQRMLRHYVELLQSLAVDISTPISRVSFVPDEERRRILAEWNATSVDYPSSTVIDVIEAQAQKTPNAIAVEFEDRYLTYAELDRLTNQIARLLDRRTQRDRPFIGVYMERSLEIVVALIAIVKAGLAYVPIDPEYPPERVAFLIEDSDPPVILTQPQYRAALTQTDAEVISLDAEDPPTEDDAPLERHLTPDSPIYMIYTSGSTGQPKGVINRHVSLLNRLFWMQSEYGLVEDDRVLQKTPFSFDVSVWEFFWPLMYGARIVVARPGGHRDTDYLKHLIQRREITTVHFIPSILNVFLEEEDLTSSCGSLRRVICSGEALSHESVVKFYTQLSCGLHNLYGPTEAAIDVSSWPCTPDYPGAVVPIGRPIANVRLYVLDKHLQLQPIGVPGELCIGGVAVANGYHNREELTARVFVNDPYVPPGGRLYRTGDLARYLPDGQIQYLGRIDNQIKLRGVRVEPEEISAVLLQLEHVKDAVVVLREVGATRMLVAYVVAEHFDTHLIKAALQQRLPEFMVPQVIVGIPRLPTTANGKLDRRALPNPLSDDTRSSPGARDSGPMTRKERAVAQAWTDVLGMPMTDVHANFFSNGGDSIQSIRVVARLRELGYQVELRHVFAQPTIHGLAATLSEVEEATLPVVTARAAQLHPADAERLPATVEDAWPLTTLQSGMIYHSMADGSSSVYHDVFRYEFAGQVRPELVDRAVQLVVAQHPHLRSTFDLTTYSTLVQLVHINATIPVRVTDLSHHVRHDQDGIIERWAEEEARLPFDLEAGPLLRIVVHVRSQTRMNLGLAFHHALLDGWSVAHLVEEIRSRYADLLAGAALKPAARDTVEAVPYSHYVELERAATADPEQARFWTRLLEDAPVTTLTAPHTQEGSSTPATTERVVAPELVAAIHEFASGLGVPTKSAYLAAHLTVIGELTGQRKVVTGLVSNCRPEVRGGEDLAGLFLNTLPCPLELHDESWSARVARVFGLEQLCLPYRRFPLAEIQRLTEKRHLFDTVFNYADFHMYAAQNPAQGVRILDAVYFEQTNFPAVVHTYRDHFSGRLRLILNYDATRIGDSLAERYLDRLLAALSELAADRKAIRVAPNKEWTDNAGPTMAQPARPVPYVSPRNQLEQRIAAIVSEALGIEYLGIDDDYLDLGLDSITSIRVVARMRKLNPGLDLATVFEQRTVRRLAYVMSDSLSRTESSRTLRPFELVPDDRTSFPIDVIDAYPASAMQVHMIRATLSDPAQAAYHDVFSYQLALPLDETVLRETLKTVVNIHETFRTSFDVEAQPNALQLVHRSVEPQLEVIDLTDIPEEYRQARFGAWFEQEKQSGFEWGRPGLIRFFAHRGDPDGFLLTLSFHHSIIDGWSLSLFIRDLLCTYASTLARITPRIAAAPALRLRDVVQAELEQRESRESRTFWRELLSGAPLTATPQFADHDETARWSETKVVLGEGRRASLRTVAKQVSIPMKYLLLAAHLRVTSLLSAQSDVVTGVVTNVRPEQDGGERMAGMFLNILPQRNRVVDQTWRELALEALRQTRLIMPHRRYPLAYIQRDSGHARIFWTVFNYTDFSPYRELAANGQNSSDGVIKACKWFEHMDFPLLVNMGHDLSGEQLVLTLNADGKFVSQNALDLIGQLYDVVLGQLAAGVGASVLELNESATSLIDELTSLSKGIRSRRAAS